MSVADQHFVVAITKVLIGIFCMIAIAMYLIEWDDHYRYEGETQVTLTSPWYTFYEHNDVENIIEGENGITFETSDGDTIRHIGSYKIKTFKDMK
jgi:hypothetical protein